MLYLNNLFGVVSILQLAEGTDCVVLGGVVKVLSLGHKYFSAFTGTVDIYICIYIDQSNCPGLAK